MTGNNYQIDSAAISDRGLSKKRPHNEDSFLELNDRGLFVVADGVGGAQAGDVASQMAVEILGEAFVNLRRSDDAEEMMKLAIERANQSIYQMSHDLEQLSTMATTIVALQIEENIATIGHVGDSRLYRLDPKGNFYRETQDHSVVEEEVRAGRMTAEQAVNHPSRNVISRALGAEYEVEVDLKTIMIEPNTTFLLCSDGITRHIDDFQLRELLLVNDPPQIICQRMKEICYERGAEDNLTAVIARVTDKIVERAKVSTDAIGVEKEEATIANVRQQARTKAAIVPPISVTAAADETPTQPLTMPISSRETTNDVPVVVREQTAIEQPIASQETIRAPLVEETVAVETATSSSKMSHLLTSLLLLIIGGLAGAGIYYLFLQNNRPPEPPQITQMQTPNIEFSSFESLRRNVDNDPVNYISRNTEMSQDAEGFYLLGRAYLLNGQFPEAKKYLEEAKNKLRQSSAVNSKVLANDIALGLAIIDESAAQNKFQSQVNANSVKNNSPVNANSNSAIR